MSILVSPVLSEAPVDDRPRAIVIGAGFGGLAAAVRLGARGYRVTVFERLEQPGGRASVFRQDGFTFDAGPTIITMPQVFEELWALAGRRFADDIRLEALSPFYRLMFADGSHLDCSADDEAMRAGIARLSPGDVAGYERFLKESEAIYGFAFEKLGHMPFTGLGAMLEALPGFVRFRADRSVYGFVRRFVSDERVRIALSFHPLFIGGNPFRVTGLYALVAHLERAYGVHFAFGGTGSLVRGLVSLIEGQGGRVLCDHEVREIMVEDGRATGVRLASGATVPASIVVSNADTGTTYSRLLPGVARRRWTDAKLDRADYSMSLFVWYFGTKRRYDDVLHHTILLGPRYQGLLDDIFRRKLLADDMSLYLHRPTATDPSLAPPGCDTFYALSPVPHLDAGVDWTRMAEPYRARIERVLMERLLPDLRDQIVTSRMITPIDFRDRLRSLKGAAFGMEPTMFQSAWFRPHNRSEEIGNLFIVGAGTHPGAGVPGVILSARLLDQLVPDAAAFR